MVKVDNSIEMLITFKIFFISLGIRYASEFKTFKGIIVKSKISFNIDSSKLVGACF